MLLTSPVPRRDGGGAGPEATPGCAGFLLQGVQAAVGHIAGIHPSQPAPDLFGVGIHPGACHAPDSAPVTACGDDLDACLLLMAQISQRLAGLGAEGLFALRGVDLR